MRSQVGVGLLLISLAVVGSPRFANAEDAPCLADAKRLCGDVAPGGGAVQKCLAKQEAQLSENCRSRMDALVKEAGLTYAACRGDIGYLCSDVVPGGGRVIACLDQNKSHLTPECASLLGSLEKK